MTGCEASPCARSVRTMAWLRCLGAFPGTGERLRCVDKGAAEPRATASPDHGPPASGKAGWAGVKVSSRLGPGSGPGSAHLRLLVNSISNPAFGKQWSHDYPIDVPATPTLPDANLRYQQTQGGCFCPLELSSHPTSKPQTCQIDPASRWRVFAVQLLSAPRCGDCHGAHKIDINDN